MVIELNNYEGNDDREEKSSIKRGTDGHSHLQTAGSLQVNST